MTSEQPDLTILLPIYNEETILEKSVCDLLQGLNARLEAGSYELLLCENGSTDDTLQIANRMALAYPALRVVHLPTANYGQALRHGIFTAHGRKIIIFNADFWDLHFLDMALIELDKHDFIVGSKNILGARDRRPIHRRMITFGFNLLLRILFGFKGTDTHGIKAMRTAMVKRLASQCVTNREIFDTELVLRAQKSGLSITEIAVMVDEKRPTRYGMLKRIPKTLADLIALIKIFWFSAEPPFADKRFYYDSIADKFDATMNPYDLRTRLFLVFDQYWGSENLHDKLLLDAGCGTGWFTKWAIDRGAKVVSLDIGEKLLLETRAKGAEQPVCGDLLCLPFPNDQFELIVCSEAIEHTLSPRQALFELARVLSPEGHLVVTTPNKFWYPALRLAAIFKLRPYEGYENWVWWDEMLHWFSQCGLEVESMQGLYLFPFQFKWLHGLLNYFNRKQLLSRYMVNIGIKGKKLLQ
jgi:2-polyprenyl-3-methyl-5-hydroxy-6-metoxy-1,4-benzoquinol methylase